MRGRRRRRCREDCLPDAFDISHYLVIPEPQHTKAVFDEPLIADGVASALGVLPAIAARYPRAAGAGLAVAEAWLAGPSEIAVVGDPDDERTRALHRTALRTAPPGAVLAFGDGRAADVPLLAGRGLVDDAPAAYVCRQFTCQAPVTTPEQLERALTQPY